MVTYEQFTAFSPVAVTADDFTFIEARSVDFLSLLCGDNWNSDSAVCIKAVEYQIEYILQNGGLAVWSEGRGVVGSHTYSIGGESESVTYMQATKEESAKFFNGLAVSPLAWALLLNGGFLKTVRGVRVW